MDAVLVTVPSQLVYMNIPARELRNFVDGLFPKLAKNITADGTTGYWHRYEYGHDLLRDVPKTFSSQGTLAGAKHLGHVVLTDFPTKAGIPIPGLSQSGLGSILEQAGISRGWMQLSMFDGGVGIFCFAEGTSDLSQALAGNLDMSLGTFFDTFVEGGIEIGFAVATQNPLLLAAGIQNMLAGVVATWNELTVYIDPLDFFGATGISALVGFGLASGLADESLSDASINGVRSGSVGAFFALSPAFGYGALAGFVAFKLGKKLAENHNASMKVLYKINDDAYQQLLDEMCRGNIHLAEFLDRAEIRITLVDDITTLPYQSAVLNDGTQILPDKLFSLDSSEVSLPSNTNPLKYITVTLPDDSPTLTDWYRQVLC